MSEQKPPSETPPTITTEQLHIAFAEPHGITLSRLDELLALLESNLDADTFDQAKQLLMATVAPLVSSRMHETAAAAEAEAKAEIEAEETRRPERNVSRETSEREPTREAPPAPSREGGRNGERAGPPSARDNHRPPPRRS